MRCGQARRTPHLNVEITDAKTLVVAVSKSMGKGGIQQQSPGRICLDVPIRRHQPSRLNRTGGQWNRCEIGGLLGKGRCCERAEENPPRSPPEIHLLTISTQMKSEVQVDVSRLSRFNAAVRRCSFEVIFEQKTRHSTPKL